MRWNWLFLKRSVDDKIMSYHSRYISVLNNWFFLENILSSSFKYLWNITVFILFDCHMIQCLFYVFEYHISIIKHRIIYYFRCLLSVNVWMNVAYFPIGGVNILSKSISTNIWAFFIWFWCGLKCHTDNWKICIRIAHTLNSNLMGWVVFIWVIN